MLITWLSYEILDITLNNHESLIISKGVLNKSQVVSGDGRCMNQSR